MFAKFRFAKKVIKVLDCGIHLVIDPPVRLSVRLATGRRSHAIRRHAPGGCLLREENK